MYAHHQTREFTQKHIYHYSMVNGEYCGYCVYGYEYGYIKTYIYIYIYIYYRNRIWPSGSTIIT